MKGHIIEDNIERYAAGRIVPGQELDGIQRHLRLCEQCSEAAEQANKLISAIRLALRVVRHNNN